MFNMDKRRLQMALTLLLLGSINACGGGGGSVPTATRVLNPSGTMAGLRPIGTMTVAGNAITNSIAIDAGGPAVANWLADTDYSSAGFAGVEKVSNTIDTSHVSNPAPAAVYQTQRYGTQLTYAIPNFLPNSAYIVRMHFVESFFNTPQRRVFNAKINGVQVLSNFDIFKVAGGENIAVTEQFATSSDSTGRIKIELSATANNASIAAIEITASGSTPMPSPSPFPTIAINIGGGATSTWLADRDYATTGWGGAATVTNPIDTSRVANPAPQTVYQTSRWAPSITYTIPGFTASAGYNVRLHFAESYWNSPGQRLFNVSINGSQKLTNFDLFQTAGGQNIAIVKEFAVNADSSGKITIALVSSVDRATISGIEILSGSGSGPSPSPSPIISPTASPSPVGNSLPASFAQAFDSSSPLRTKLANLKYTTVQSPLSSSIWSQQNFTASAPVTTGIPLYVSSNPTDKLVTVAPCTLYGGGCSMAGKQVHINPADLAQAPPYDQHIFIIDQSKNVEIDCWEAKENSNGTPDLSNNTLTCGWGGWYPLNSTGLNGIYSNENSPNNGSGIAFGPAAGLFMVTPQELLAGAGGIQHALALNANCMDAPSVYPSDYGGTDKTCDGGTNYPHYGDAIMYVAQTDAQIAASSRSTPCKAILTALHDYGAYFSDTGDGTTRIDVVSADAYRSDPSEMGGNPDPFAAVYSELNAAGDGSGSSWEGCFNGLNPSNFNLIELNHP